MSKKSQQIKKYDFFKNLIEIIFFFFNNPNKMGRKKEKKLKPKKSATFLVLPIEEISIWPKLSSRPSYIIQGGYPKRDTRTNEQREILCPILDLLVDLKKESNGLRFVERANFLKFLFYFVKKNLRNSALSSNMSWLFLQILQIQRKSWSSLNLKKELI